MGPFAKKRIILLLFMLLLYGSVEGLSVLGLFLLERTNHVTYKPFDYGLADINRKDLLKFISGDRKGTITHHPILGWSSRADALTPLERINSQGIRSAREYTPAPEANTLRIAAFGDSFVFCCEVRDSDSWESVMETERPNLEVLNFGVGGYGLDQAYLRYKTEGVMFNPHLVFIGFFSQCLERNVSVFPPAMVARVGRRSLPFTKPRFTLRDGMLVLSENPLPRLNDYERLLNHGSAFLDSIEEDDHFLRLMYRKGPLDFLPSVRLIKLLRYGWSSRFSEGRLINADRTFNRSSEAFPLTAGLMEAFHDESVRNGSTPVILFFPAQDEISRCRQDGKKSYGPLLDLVRRKGYRFIDLMEVFDSSVSAGDLDSYFMPVGHYSPAGNRLIAGSLLDYLSKNGLLDPDGR